MPSRSPTQPGRPAHSRGGSFFDTRESTRISSHRGNGLQQLLSLGKTKRLRNDSSDKPKVFGQSWSCISGRTNGRWCGPSLVNEKGLSIEKPLSEAQGS